MTASERYLSQMSKLSMVVLSDAEPVDYFESGNGAAWLLIQIDGMRALIGYCMSFDQQLVS